MPKIYKRRCDACRKYYESQNIRFCSRKCARNFVICGFILNNRHTLSDGSWYPKIPSLCECGCNEVVWNNDEWVSGHNTRISHPMLGHKHTDKSKESMSIGNTKLFLLKPDGSKEIYPPIPITCQCKNIHCNEIVWGGREFVSGHNVFIDGHSFDPYCYKFDDELKEVIRKRDHYVCQNCGRIWLLGTRRFSPHHIHYDKQNCYPDLICLCSGCNVRANHNKDYWEKYYMNKLNDRELLFWTRRIKINELNQKI